MSTKAGITQRWREYALGWGRVASPTRTEKCRLPRRLLVPPAPPLQGLANDYHRHDHPGTPDQACDEDAVGRGHAGLRVAALRCGFDSDSCTASRSGSGPFGLTRSLLDALGPSSPQTC